MTETAETETTETETAQKQRPPGETAPERAARGRHARAVSARALSGVKALTLRTAASVGLRVVGSLCLAHLLFPRDYGLFAASAYLTGLGMFLSDVGLGGALIRQAETPTGDETFTVFWAQQAITGAVALALIALAPWLLPLYGMSRQAAPLLDSMALGLFFSSLRVVPTMALERELRFAALARCELWENLAQTGGTIGLAALGCGAWALAGGGLLRGTVGLACVWAASPWRPRGAFQFAIVRRLSRFGLSYQLNALVPTLLGNWMPIVVGRLLGVAAVGLVGWAINIASVPLMFSGVLNRVAFPALSRLQGDPDALAHSLCASLRRLNALLCLLVPPVVLLCPLVIPSVFGRRWSPAVPLVQWFSVEIVLLTLNGLLCATQNATGYAADRLWIALGTGALRVGLGTWGIARFGLTGLGPAACLATLVELIVSAAAVVSRHSHCRKAWPEIFRPLFLSGSILGVAVGAAWLGARHEARTQAVIALGIFLFLTAAQDQFSRSHPLWTEMRALARMLRPAETPQ